MTISSKNIDQEFANAMRSIGGVRPVELDPTCLDKENADIVLRADNTIIEVKTLLKDPRETAEFQAALLKLYTKWVKQGKIPPQQSGPKILSTLDIPDECAREFALRVTRRIKKIAEKSNRQIKELKNHLNLPTAKGLLVLCNAGNSFFSPHMVLHSLHHALGKDNSSIHWLIYLTYQLPVKLPGVQQPMDIFGQPVRKGYSPMPSELFQRIKNAWMQKAAGGKPITVIKGEDSDVLFDAVHVQSQWSG